MQGVLRTDAQVGQEKRADSDAEHDQATRIAAALMVVSFTGSFWYVRYRTRPSKEDKKRTHFVKQHEGVRPCRRVWKTKSQPFTCAEAPKTSRAR